MASLLYNGMNNQLFYVFSVTPVFKIITHHILLCVCAVYVLYVKASDRGYNI